MTTKEKSEITVMLKEIWFKICVLEHDYGIEYDGHMTQIVKFTLQCIANKYDIDLGLNKE
mgnify:CR=1 FL=1